MATVTTLDPSASTAREATGRGNGRRAGKAGPETTSAALSHTDPRGKVGSQAAQATPSDRQPAVDGILLPNITDIWSAQAVIRPHVYHTPLLHSRAISALSGADVHLKAENLQRSGAYKIRGATYKLSRLTREERKHGVIAASAGNHAQGVAIAAAALGIPCTIVMPVGAPLAKVTATQGYGARVVLHGETYNEAYARARELQRETGAVSIHAFDDPDIIA